MTRLLRKLSWLLRDLWREVTAFAGQLLTCLLVVAAMLVAGLALLVWFAR